MRPPEPSRVLQARRCRSFGPATFPRLAALAISVLAGTLAGQPPPAVVRVERLVLDPAQPKATETLCKLTVVLHNTSDRPISELRFVVRLNGEPLKVYDKQLFYQELPPGASTEVRLFNFWTVETRRPRPANGKIAVEVALTAARSMTIELEGDTETWTPGEPIAGLPAVGRAELTVP